MLGESERRRRGVLTEITLPATCEFRQSMTEQTNMFSWVSPGKIVLTAVVLVFGWGLTQKTLHKHRETADFNAKDAAARRGNPVLALPEELSSETPSDLQAIGKCTGGLDGRGYSMCFGEGAFLGIPGDLTVEWTPNHQLHYLAYELQLASAKVLIPRLTELYGPPHRFDGLPASGYAIGVCWPLPNGQAVVMQRGDDNERTVSVMLESQVAENLYQLLEAVPRPCPAQPLVLPKAFDTD
jgi:hypothetical protein